MNIASQENPPNWSFQYPFWMLFVIIFFAALIAWEIRDQLQVVNIAVIETTIQKSEISNP